MGRYLLQLAPFVISVARELEKSDNLPKGIYGGRIQQRANMTKIAAHAAAEPGGNEPLSHYFSWPFQRGHALGYALAPATVAITFAARILLTPVLNDGS